MLLVNRSQWRSTLRLSTPGGVMGWPDRPCASLRAGAWESSRSRGRLLKIGRRQQRHGCAEGGARAVALVTSRREHLRHRAGHRGGRCAGRCRGCSGHGRRRSASIAGGHRGGGRCARARARCHHRGRCARAHPGSASAQERDRCAARSRCSWRRRSASHRRVRVASRDHSQKPREPAWKSSSLRHFLQTERTLRAVPVA